MLCSQGVPTELSLHPLLLHGQAGNGEALCIHTHPEHPRAELLLAVSDPRWGGDQ